MRCTAAAGIIAVCTFISRIVQCGITAAVKAAGMVIFNNLCFIISYLSFAHTADSIVNFISGFQINISLRIAASAALCTIIFRSNGMIIAGVFIIVIVSACRTASCTPALKLIIAAERCCELVDSLAVLEIELIVAYQCDSCITCAGMTCFLCTARRKEGFVAADGCTGYQCGFVNMT